MAKRNKYSNKKIQKRARLYRMSRSMLDWLKLGGVVVLFCTFVFSCWHFVFNSAYFALKNVEFKGDVQHLTQDDILNLAHIPYGENIFRINLYQIIHNIKRYAWIGEVQVRRKFPRSIIIHVDEYEPLAVVEAHGSKKGQAKYFLMSQQGKLFKSIAAKDLFPNYLPVIKGFGLNDLEQYPNYYRYRLQKVYTFITSFNEDQLNDIWKIKELNYDEVDGFTASLQGENENKNIKVHFGKFSYPEKQELWHKFVKSMEASNQWYKEADLHVEKKVFARIN